MNDEILKVLIVENRFKMQLKKWESRSPRILKAKIRL